VISVRQTGSLPPASFRFPVAGDTLALSYALGTTYPYSGLSPVRLRPCRAHQEKTTRVPKNPNRLSLFSLVPPLTNSIS